MCNSVATTHNVQVFVEQLKKSTTSDHMAVGSIPAIVKVKLTALLNQNQNTINYLQNKVHISY